MASARARAQPNMASPVCWWMVRHACTADIADNNGEGWQTRCTTVKARHRAPAQRPIPPAIVDSYLLPSRRDAAVRHDLRRFLRGVQHRHTLAAARALPQFHQARAAGLGSRGPPVPPRAGPSAGRTAPQATVVTIRDSYTFVPEDQPARLARLVVDFARTHATTEPAGALALHPSRAGRHRPRVVRRARLRAGARRGDRHRRRRHPRRALPPLRRQAGAVPQPPDGADEGLLMPALLPVLAQLGAERHDRGGAADRPRRRPHGRASRCRASAPHPAVRHGPPATLTCPPAREPGQPTTRPQEVATCANRWPQPAPQSSLCWHPVSSAGSTATSATPCTWRSWRASSGRRWHWASLRCCCTPRPWPSPPARSPTSTRSRPWPASSARSTRPTGVPCRPGGRADTRGNRARQTNPEAAHALRASQDRPNGRPGRQIEIVRAARNSVAHPRAGADLSIEALHSVVRTAEYLLRVFRKEPSA